MDFSTFDNRLDAIELDPRVAAKRHVRNVVEVRMRGIPDGVAAQITGSRLTTLADRIAAAIERGNPTAIGELIDAFEIDLMNAIRDARERGALKPRTNGVEERLGVLEAHGYLAKEQNHARLMIVAPERLERVDYFSLTTNRRTISRDELRAFGRPMTWTNDSSWNAQFVSDRNVRAIEAEAAERERQAARGPWADNRNMDLPDPRR